MSIKHLTENMGLVLALNPVADLYNTTATKPINASKASNVDFIIVEGGGTGTGTIKAYAYDDASQTNPVAVPFKIRLQSNADATDETCDAYDAALADVTAAGYNTTAGGPKNIYASIDPRSLGGKQFCGLRFSAKATAACTGNVVAVGINPSWTNGSQSLVT
jgi:hypothetical protein